MSHSEITLAMWLNAHDGVRQAIIAIIVVSFLVVGLMPDPRTPRRRVITPERRGGPWVGKLTRPTKKPD